MAVNQTVVVAHPLGQHCLFGGFVWLNVIDIRAELGICNVRRKSRPVLDIGIKPDSVAVNIGTKKWFLWNNADFAEGAPENGAKQDAADLFTGFPL